MEITLTQALEEKKRFYKLASGLALTNILINLVRGLLSLSLGFQDRTLVLCAFGLDSLAGVAYGIGIWGMNRHMKGVEIGCNATREKRAFQLSGVMSYLLAAGLTVAAAINIYQRNRPESAFWGVSLSIVSVLSTWLLMDYKVKIGRQYNSKTMLSSANWTMSGMYPSLILFVSSIGYEAAGISLFDSIGALAIAFVSFNEGRLAFERAKSPSVTGAYHDDNL